MAGNKNDPEQQQVPLGGVKTFECPNCGGTVELRAPGQSMTAGCIHCGSVIDLSDQNFQLVQTMEKAQKVKPIIPFGKRGEIDGITWEMIGFMVRKNPQAGWAWQEYLLFNPWHGYAFLAVSDGHWTFIRSMMDRPTEVGGKVNASVQNILSELADVPGGLINPGAARIVKYQKSSYTLSDKYPARVRYVAGEFFWRVKVGETVRVFDYVDQPNMLTLEKDESGSVWSKGRYMSPKEVKSTFDLKRVPPVKGYAAHQPNPHKQKVKDILPVWLIFLAALIVGQIIFAGMSRDEVVFKDSFVATQKDQLMTKGPFDIPGGTSNVEIGLTATVDNQWTEIEGSLNREGTDQHFGFLIGAEYYHGYTGGENWSEGSQHSSLVVNGVPGGKYFLNLTAHSGYLEKGESAQYRLSIKRDVSVSSNFWLLFLFASIYPIWLIVQRIRFEANRTSYLS